MNKKIRLAVVMAVIAGALALLISSGLKNNTGSYLTIKEALEVQKNSTGEYIQMEGNLAEESTVWDPDNVVLKFDLTDGQNKITISYNGVKPDNFDSGYPIIVEGKFDNNHTFAADTVKVRCPSKYEAESEEQPTGK